MSAVRTGIAKEQSSNSSATLTVTKKVTPFNNSTILRHLRRDQNQNDTDANLTEQEPEIVRVMKKSLQSLYDQASRGFTIGLMPHMERERRAAKDGDKSYLDLVIWVVGAILGRQECSQMVACR